MRVRDAIKKVEVAAHATGLTPRAGTALLALVAQRLGLPDGLGRALAETRERRAAHDSRTGSARRARRPWSRRGRRARRERVIIDFDATPVTSLVMNQG